MELVCLGRNRFMARPLAKSPFVLLALGLWILACRHPNQMTMNSIYSINKSKHCLNKESIKRLFLLRERPLN